MAVGIHADGTGSGSLGEAGVCAGGERRGGGDDAAGGERVGSGAGGKVAGLRCARAGAVGECAERDPGARDAGAERGGVVWTRQWSGVGWVGGRGGGSAERSREWDRGSGGGGAGTACGRVGSKQSGGAEAGDGVGDVDGGSGRAARRRKRFDFARHEWMVVWRRDTGNGEPAVLWGRRAAIGKPHGDGGGARTDEAGRRDAGGDGAGGAAGQGAGGGVSGTGGRKRFDGQRRRAGAGSAGGAAGSRGGGGAERGAGRRRAGVRCAGERGG